MMTWVYISRLDLMGKLQPDGGVLVGETRYVGEGITPVVIGEPLRDKTVYELVWAFYQKGQPLPFPLTVEIEDGVVIVYLYTDQGKTTVLRRYGEQLWVRRGRWVEVIRQRFLRDYPHEYAQLMGNEPLPLQDDQLWK